MPVCETSFLGLTPYDEAHALQGDLVERRKRDEISDQFLLLEHPCHNAGSGGQSRERPGRRRDARDWASSFLKPAAAI